MLKVSKLRQSAPAVIVQPFLALHTSKIKVIGLRAESVQTQTECSSCYRPAPSCPVHTSKLQLYRLKASEGLLTHGVFPTIIIQPLLDLFKHQSYSSILPNFPLFVISHNLLALCKHHSYSSILPNPPPFVKLKPFLALSKHQSYSSILPNPSPFVIIQNFLALSKHQSYSSILPNLPLSLSTTFLP